MAPRLSHRAAGKLRGYDRAARPAARGRSQNTFNLGKPRTRGRKRILPFNPAASFVRRRAGIPSDMKPRSILN